MKNYLRNKFYLTEKLLVTIGLKTIRNKRHLPDFIGIGAQKSGTTWLYEKLRQHPDVYLPSQKELHYFTGNYHAPIRYYESYFKDSGNRISGEITPAYSTLSRRRIKFISRLTPEVRIILILRDPRDRAWSQLRMHVGRLGYSSVEDYGIDNALELLKSSHFTTRGNYVETVNAWTSVFPEEQILVLNYSEISKNPVGFINKVLGHIGADPFRESVGLNLEERVFAGSKEEVPTQIAEFLSRSNDSVISGIVQRYPSTFKDWR